ncbi:MAG: hypothetical protein ACP5E8_01370 [Thermoplasmata archaeon]
MNTLFLFILVIVVLLIIYLISYRFSKPKEYSKIEDDAFNKISLSREIIRKIATSEVRDKFEGELKGCEELFGRKEYIEAEKCAESVLSGLRNFSSKNKGIQEEEPEIICKHCGTKLAKKYDFCPICGEKL